MRKKYDDEYDDEYDEEYDEYDDEYEDEYEDDDDEYKDDYEYERRRKPGRKKKRFNWVGLMTVVMIVVLLLLVGVYAAVQHYYSKSNFVSDDSVELAQDSEIETDSTGVTDEEAQALQSEILAEVENIDVAESEGVYNILLIGVDRRDKSWYGNSDSMILMSINHNTKTIHMTSFMRDLYANIPDVGVKKLNAACAYGGGPLLVKTIEDNYRLDIDNYASVDFDAMIDIVDLVGGIDIELSSGEVNAANGCIEEMCQLRGVSSSSHLLSSSGMQHLDGYQAVGYARVRKVGNADYQRTERQREVLSKIMEKSKSLSVTDLNALAEAVLPKITHNIDQTELLTLIGQLPTFLSYEIVQSRVPYDDLYSSRGEMLVPDFTATIERLHTEIYGSES